MVVTSDLLLLHANYIELAVALYKDYYNSFLFDVLMKPDIEEITL